MKCWNGLFEFRDHHKILTGINVGNILQSIQLQMRKLYECFNLQNKCLCWEMHYHPKAQTLANHYPDIFLWQCTLSLHYFDMVPQPMYCCSIMLTGLTICCWKWSPANALFPPVWIIFVKNHETMVSTVASQKEGVFLDGFCMFSLCLCGTHSGWMDKTRWGPTHRGWNTVGFRFSSDLVTVTKNIHSNIGHVLWYQ